MHPYTLYLHEQLMADRHRRLRDDVARWGRLREAKAADRTRPRRPAFAARLLTALLYW